jgi:hypothetical protein
MTDLQIDANIEWGFNQLSYDVLRAARCHKADARHLLRSLRLELFSSGWISSISIKQAFNRSSDLFLLSSEEMCGLVSKWFGATVWESPEYEPDYIK